MMSQAIYSSANCTAAYQLNWSLSVFGRIRLPSPEGVADELRTAVARDDLRILEFRTIEPNIAQFLVSSQPKHSPAAIIHSIKGRWQYVARGSERLDLRRNYRMVSIGSAKSTTLEDYVSAQNARHPMADASVQSMLESLQFCDPSVSPAVIRRSSYGEFTHALQIVLETESNWQETRREVLCGYRDQIRKTCESHDWLLARVGLLSNHMHILLSAGVNDSPMDIALALLNDLASTQGMKPVFKHSYYVGTFGEYDRGAIWNTNRNLVSDEIEEYLQLL